MRQETLEENAQRLQANMNRVLGLIDEHIAEPRRTQVLEMLGVVGDEYFTCPASARDSHHLAEAGGLAEHSLHVFENLLRIVEAFAPGRWPVGKLLFCALFHDFGKIGDGERPYYVPTQLRWKKERGEWYDYNNDCVAMPTSERGLFILQKHGIVLDHEEYLSIRLNDGQYPDENRWYAMREPELALLVHMADLWSTRMEKDRRY